MPLRRLRLRLRTDDGMVTAETAVVLPVLLLVLAGAIAAVTIVAAQLRCVDAAREGARAAARGEDLPAVTALVARAAPDGSSTSVDAGVEQVRVSVLADVALLGPLPLRVRVSADAVAMREPGVAEAAG